MTPSGLHFHSVWDWRARGFGSPAAAFRAGFLQLQKPTMGTASRLSNDPIRPSLLEAPLLHLELVSYTASESNIKHRQLSLKRPRPAFTFIVFGTGGPVVLEARPPHLELVSYSFRKQRHHQPSFE